MFSVNRLLCALAASLLVAAPALAQSPAKTRPNVAAQSSPAFTYDQSEAAMAFAEDIASRRDLDPAWVREQIADPIVTTGTLAGSPFAIATDRPAADGAELGLSLALDRGATQLSADYAGQFRADYASHALTLNGAIRF